ALRVDRGGADADREPGGEPGGASDIERLLAGLGDASRDDLADLGGVDAGAVDDGALRGGEEIRRGHGRPRAVPPAQRRTSCLDDDVVGVGGRCHAEPPSPPQARMAASAAVRVASFAPLASRAICGMRCGCLAKYAATAFGLVVPSWLLSRNTSSSTL